MINTISSLTSFESFGNPGFASGDAPDTDAYADLFAALFPESVPMTPIPVSETFPSKTSEEPETADLLDLGISLCATARVSNPGLTPKIANTHSPTVASSISEQTPASSSDQIGLGGLGSIDISSHLSDTQLLPIPGLVPSSVIPSMQNVTSSRGEQWQDTGLAQPRVDDPASIDLATLLMEPETAELPEFLPRMSNFTKPEPDSRNYGQTPLSNALQAETADLGGVVDSFVLLDQSGQEILELGPQIPDIRFKPATEEVKVPSAESEAGKAPLEFAPVPIMHESKVKKLPFVVTSFAVADEVVEVPVSDGEPAGFARATTSLAYGSRSTLPVEEPKDLPKLFKDVSSVVRADNSLRTTFQDDPFPNAAIIEKIKQNFSNGGSQIFAQHSPIELLTDVEDSGETFDAFGTTHRLLPKEQEVFALVQNDGKMTGRVFDQVEPRLLELISLNQKDPEKRALKMRLSPADLGMVEITVERNEAGRINAHFQTESQATREILNESLVQLRDSLEKSGVQVGEIDISCTTLSSNGNEGRGKERQEFGSAEDQPGGTTDFDGISQTEDDKQDRLLNLRA